MSKEKGDDEEEVPKYKNSPAQELESWKQIQHKIDVSFHKTAEKEFEEYAQRLQEKNTYFNNTKHPEINSKDIADDKMRTIKKFSGEISNEFEENDYCIYCTSRITPCPHRRKRENLNEKYEYPITSSSVYGWFKPYDNMQENHNKNSVTREFFDQTHL